MPDRLVRPFSHSSYTGYRTPEHDFGNYPDHELARKEEKKKKKKRKKGKEKEKKKRERKKGSRVTEAHRNKHVK